MRLLLDTHGLLWALADPRELRAETRAATEDGSSEAFVSAASAWEIAIERALARLEFPDDLGAVIGAAAFDELPITIEHDAAARRLPAHHRDPFDRMLVAQAAVEGLTLVTRDSRLSAYGIPLLEA